MAGGGAKLFLRHFHGSPCPLNPVLFAFRHRSALVTRARVFWRRQVPGLAGTHAAGSAPTCRFAVRPDHGGMGRTGSVAGGSPRRAAGRIRPGRFQRRDQRWRGGRPDGDASTRASDSPLSRRPTRPARRSALDFPGQGAILAMMPERDDSECDPAAGTGADSAPHCPARCPVPAAAGPVARSVAAPAPLAAIPVPLAAVPARLIESPASHISGERGSINGGR